MATVYNRGFLIQIDGTTRIPVNNDSFTIGTHLGSDIRIRCAENGGCVIKSSFGKKVSYSFSVSLNDVPSTARMQRNNCRTSCLQCTIHNVDPLEPATLNSKPVIGEGEILKDGDNIQIGGKTYKWEYVDQENDM